MLSAPRGAWFVTRNDVQLQHLRPHLTSRRAEIGQVKAECKDCIGLHRITLHSDMMILINLMIYGYIW